MRRLIAIPVLGIVLAAASLWGQQIPAGTLLPALLNGNLDSDKSKPGEEISAKLMQDVPLPNGGKIRRESKILGHVVSVTRSPAKIVIQFDHVEMDKQPVPVSASLRAVASMELVNQAQSPTNPSPGTSVWDWIMSQVGGQIAYNGQKVVKDGSGQVVARIVDPGAVVGTPLPNPARGCTGASNNGADQAFWIFSTDACGVYGFEGLTADRGAGANPTGKITFQSPNRITIRGGSGFLLRVRSVASQASAAGVR